ncbi:DUF2723 domain-containing protein [Rhodocaloribacter litoris]|uniref:protein O-mannosyl-transferase family n=1 Tax=Rhodocaloribacter litoris TaxID=2558931 RepID=UPI001420E2CA|nr:DUF2723 domain-containing protein [Rhodocaloribacter litoris]QXD14550.1 DUF2723 domain-containing protein [Rhodocaloribacter litoris]
MNWKLTERLVAAAVFLYALVLYVLTVAPTAEFWDSGEFIAIANRLEVSHPPGAPFYMLIGRLFSMFVPAPHVALAVNLVSVLASALTVLLTHLIIVRLVREWQGAPATWTTGDRLAALAGGVIGACTFAATDSFWFNAVEAEVYALSMLFTALVVWLILKWREEALQEEAALAGRGQHPFGLATNRYLLLIAYLFGLAIGVHLLNLLAIFFIALIFFYTEFEKPDWTPRQRWLGLLGTGLVSTLAFFLIFPVIVQWLPDWAGRSGAPFLFFFAVVALVAFAVYYTHTRGLQAANLVALSITLVLIGYSTYALIFIRSMADPPIDENDPETAEAIVYYLKREQYGNTPILKGPTFDNRLRRVDTRREVLFPRRHSPDPNHERVYAQYDSDLDFFLHYQLGHMYVRYFLWNFVGRAADVQDAPHIVTFSDARAKPYLQQTPSERASRNAYYGLPLLLGLIGMAFHFWRDWRRAFAVFILFFVTGIGIILYLNQPPLQPRERDYSYVASFFAFSLWVGIGASGLIETASHSLRRRLGTLPLAAPLGIAAVLAAAVPFWMTYVNYDDHDRSGRYVAPDYAYNMLMSVEENAILFTNGDNDTFPLWYLQEVEGIRRDVRVVNLSLLNTDWYIRQLKNQWSRESAPLPISLSEREIASLNVVRWQPRELALPVDRQKLFDNPEFPIPAPDTNRIESPMRWTLRGRPFGRDENGQEINILYVADQVVLDILTTNARQNWERPVYFAVTVSPDGQLDLQDYFQLEGQAYRVVPIKTDDPLGRVVPEITPRRLRQFRFTNLNDPDVYYDENIRRMVDGYRTVFSHTAESLAEQGHAEEARTLLDDFMEAVPFDTIPGDERSFLFMARAYQAAGDSARAIAILQQAEPVVLHRLRHPRSERDLEMAARFVQMLQLAYLDARDFEAAAAFSTRLAETLEDSTYRQDAEELRRLYDQMLGRPAPQPPPGP